MFNNKRLRETSGSIFHPAKLANTAAMFDSFSTSSITLDGSNNVQEWRSLKGSGLFSHANAGNRPPYDSTLKRVRFTQIWQILTGTNLSNVTQNVPRFVAILCIKYGDLTADRIGLLMQTGATTSRIYLAQSSIIATRALEVGGRRLDADPIAGVNAGTQSTSKIIQTGVFDYQTKTAQIRLNGTLRATNSNFQTIGNTSNTSSLNVFLGAANTNDRNILGDVYGLILGYFTESEIIKIERWMMGRYGVV